MILDDVYAFLGRFVAYPSDDARVTHTLWIAHTHLMNAWEQTPRIAFLSPEPQSGKTRALEITELLVPRPILAFNTTAAYILRKVAKAGPEEKPTVLYDEIDTIFGDKANGNEELRGLINAGNRKGALAGKCVVKGKEIDTEEFEAYGAVGMAGLGNLPDTILSRSVIVRMQKRKNGERVESYRHRMHKPEGDVLRDQLTAWAETIKHKIGAAFPEMPEGVEDRNADMWEPLLAVADAAGVDWPERARRSAVSLVSQGRKDGNASLGTQLLRDLRTIFKGEKQLFTSEIIVRLQKVDEAPWGHISKGAPITDRLLARLLRQYGVESKQIRIKDETRKGYESADLIDAWERYLVQEEEQPKAAASCRMSGARESSDVDFCNNARKVGFAYDEQYIDETPHTLPAARKSHALGSHVRETRETEKQEFVDKPSGHTPDRMETSETNGKQMQRSYESVREMCSKGRLWNRELEHVSTSHIEQLADELDDKKFDGLGHKQWLEMDVQFELYKRRIQEMLQGKLPLKKAKAGSTNYSRKQMEASRVEDGRGSLGPMASAPFPIPAHQTERADFRHSAFRSASPQGPRWSAALCWCSAMTPRHVTYLRLAV